MADINYTTRYGDSGSNVGNRTSTAVTANQVKIAADTVYDFLSGRRTSTTLFKDNVTVFSMFEQALVQFHDFHSDKTS